MYTVVSILCLSAYTFMYLGEWISGPVCMYISLYLVKNSDTKQVSFVHVYPVLLCT